MLPELSPELALSLFRASYVALMIGGSFVLLGTTSLFWSDNEIKRHDNVRLSDNEIKTAEAVEGAAVANAEAAKANEQAAQAEARAAEAELKTEELRRQVGPRQLDRVTLIELAKAGPAALLEIM